MIKKIVLALLAALVLNTVRYGNRPAPTVPAVDAEAAVQRLAEAVRFKTVSNQEPGSRDAEAFLARHAFFEEGRASMPS